jgi:hypothetical protein
MSTSRHLVSHIFFCAAAFIFLTASPVFAKDVSLTEDNVGRFLASFAEMRIIAVSEGFRASTDQDATKNPVAAVIKAIKSSKLQSEAKTIAAKHGFASVSDWADTGRSIGQAYVYITFGSSGISKSAVDKGKDNAMKELAKLGLLTEKQKQRLKDNLDEVGDQITREPPEGNVAIVTKMKPDIEAAMKIAGK